LRLGEEGDAIYRYFMVKNQSFCRYFREGGLVVGFLERGGEVGFLERGGEKGGKGLISQKDYLS
jgi:hypothetical protein